MYAKDMMQQVRHTKVSDQRHCPLQLDLRGAHLVGYEISQEKLGPKHYQARHRRTAGVHGMLTAQKRKPWKIHL
jgi:hypothetical protein